ncbi:unnamed protein product [Enterobius vermicularis]|uniref:DUF834 domain-containing protein n=1 Tax=Enterobius vermicularis TaxID=51028 RepID=A0A0N4VMS3_ENTVE|nr:unnamed protein product [Enterobius vermicularis]
MEGDRREQRRGGRNRRAENGWVALCETSGALVRAGAQRNGGGKGDGGRGKWTRVGAEGDRRRGVSAEDEAFDRLKTANLSERNSKIEESEKCHPLPTPCIHLALTFVRFSSLNQPHIIFLRSCVLLE